MSALAGMESFQHGARAKGTTFAKVTYRTTLSVCNLGSTCEGTALLVQYEYTMSVEVKRIQRVRETETWIPVP